MDNTQYLLDTNICVFFLRGKYDIPSFLEKVGLRNCHISEITVAELLYGAECSQDPLKNTRMVKQFCADIDVLPISYSIDTYSKQKALLRRNGLPIDDFDLLIGSTAIRYDMVLVTDNVRHFNRLPVIIENWIRRD